MNFSRCNLQISRYSFIDISSICNSYGQISFSALPQFSLTAARSFAASVELNVAWAIRCSHLRSHLHRGSYVQPQFSSSSGSIHVVSCSISFNEDPLPTLLLLPFCRLHRGLPCRRRASRSPISIALLLLETISICLRRLASGCWFRRQRCWRAAEAVEVGVVEGGGKGVAALKFGEARVWRGNMAKMKGWKWEFIKDEGWKKWIWQNWIRHVALPNRISRVILSSNRIKNDT